MNSVSVIENSEYENPKQIYDELNDIERHSSILETEIGNLFDPRSYDKVSEANRRELQKRMDPTNTISEALYAWSHGPSNPESDILVEDGNSDVETVKEYTQQFLKDYFDTEEILLYRGCEGGEFEGNPENFTSNNTISSNKIESWSLDPKVAQRFMDEEGLLMKRKMPIDDVVSCYLTHPSLQEFRSEKEFVVQNKDEEIELNNLETFRTEYSIQDMMEDLEDSLEFIKNE